MDDFVVIGKTKEVLENEVKTNDRGIFWKKEVSNYHRKNENYTYRWWVWFWAKYSQVISGKSNAKLLIKPLR
jgi:hypothetical protein